MGQLFSALQLSFISKRLESVHAARAQWCNQRTLTQKALMTQYNRYKVVACLLLKTKANNSSTKPQKPYCITINLWN